MHGPGHRLANFQVLDGALPGHGGRAADFNRCRRPLFPLPSILRRLHGAQRLLSCPAHASADIAVSVAVRRYCCALDSNDGEMSLPALQQHATGYPGSPATGHGEGHRDFALSADITKRRVDDQRRLRRVKDSREQLKSRTRARGASDGTIDTLTSSSGGGSGGRNYTVANIHNGVIYLR